MTMNRRMFLASLLAVPVAAPAVKPLAEYVCGVDLAVPGSEETAFFISRGDLFEYGATGFKHISSTYWHGFPPVIRMSPMTPPWELPSVGVREWKIRTKFDPLRLPV